MTQCHFFNSLRNGIVKSAGFRHTNWETTLFSTCTTRSQNSILRFLLLRTNRMANLLYAQTSSSPSHTQTNGWTEEFYHQGSVNTLVRCLGHFLMPVASAPS